MDHVTVTASALQISPNMMPTIQLFCVLATVFFVLIGVMVNGGNVVGLLLKAFAWCMVIFGSFVTAAVFGFVLQNGIRLI